jgi:hypothetical protein
MRSAVRRKHRFSVFENKMLRRTCQPNSQVKKNYRDLHNKEFHYTIYIFYVII